MGNRLPVTLAIITMNEESKIGRCIESCPWASEIVVVDSGSQDRTVEIAKKMGATVVVEKFRGYRGQKQYATDLAKNNWVLSLDADEVLSPDLAQEIERLFQNGVSRFDGYEMPRKSYHMGQWILHGGWYPDYQLRLFDKTRGKWTGGNVHERVDTKTVKRLRGEILHHVFDSLADQVDANNRYSTLGAMDLHQRGKKFSFLKLVLKPISKFFETYLFKRGFLDGMPGFIISVGASYSVFLKFAKLRELEKKGGS